MNQRCLVFYIPRSGSPDLCGIIMKGKIKQQFLVIKSFYDNTAGCSFFVLPGSLKQRFHIFYLYFLRTEPLDGAGTYFFDRIAERDM